jgi:hypothetical protein
MDLISFARQLSPDRSDQEFIDLLKEVVDLDALKSLSDKEAQNISDAAQFLADYMLLQKEFYGQEKTMDGHPYIVCNAPYIETQLTRAAGTKPDFSYLETYGVSK